MYAGQGNEVRRVGEAHVAPVRVVDYPPRHGEEGLLLSQVRDVLRQGAVRMVDDEAAVEQFEEEELALEDVCGAVGVLLLVHVSVLLPHEILALGDELVRAHHATFLHLGGEVDAGGAEEERVDVAQGVGAVEPPVVHDSSRDDLLAEL